MINNHFYNNLSFEPCLSEIKEISWENDSKRSEEVKITLKRTRREEIEERKISVPRNGSSDCFALATVIETQ